MVAGGARWPGLGWRGGEVGMEWWHYLETESFYRNISGSSVTRPHCAHTAPPAGSHHPAPSHGNQEPGARRLECISFQEEDSEAEENARIFLCQATFFRCCLSDNYTLHIFPFYPK